LSDRQIRNLLADGVLPSSKGPGGLDVDACRLAYVRYLRGLANGQVRAETPPDYDDQDGDTAKRLEQERLRLTAAQAEGQELKNEVAKRRSVPTEFATFALSRIVPAISSAFDTLPMVMRRRHPDLQARHLDTLEREATKIRNAAAQFADRLPGLLDEYLDSTD